MKLGTKLGMAFAVLVLLTMVVCGFAIVQFSSMYTRTQNLAEIWLPAIKVLGEMRTAANQLCRRDRAKRHRHIEPRVLVPTQKEIKFFGGAADHS